MKLTTEKTIAMAHHLINYDGDCSNVHGHNVRVQVMLEGKQKKWFSCRLQSCKENHK